MTKLKTILQAVGASVLLTVAAGLHADPLRIGYNQWAGFAPVFVAAEKGLFTAEGIEVDLRVFPGPADSIPALVAGHLDLSLTTPDALIPLNDGGVSVLTVMVLDASHGGDGIIAKDSINNIEDLRGKRIGVTEGEVNHLLLMLALEQAGLSGDDIRIANMNADDAGAAFIGGQLDAAVTWEPWLSNSVSQGAGKVLFTSADAPDMLIDVVAVTPETLAAREQDIAAFVRAVDKALAMMESDPDSSNAIIGRWLDIDAAEIGEMLEGIRLYGTEHNKTLFSGENAESNIAVSFERIGNFLKSQGLAQGTTDVKEMLDGRLFTN
jgi:NitT/TauT family transport system substrate-binding protein